MTDVATIYSIEHSLFEGDPILNWQDIYPVFELAQRNLPTLPDPKILVESDYDNGGACYRPRNNSIVFSPNGLKLYIVVHEIAHWAERHISGLGGHGRSWVDLYVHLVRQIRSDDWANELQQQLEFVK